MSAPDPHDMDIVNEWSTGECDREATEQECDAAFAELAEQERIEQKAKDAAFNRLIQMYLLGE